MLPHMSLGDTQTFGTQQPVSFAKLGSLLLLVTLDVFTVSYLRSQSYSTFTCSDWDRVLSQDKTRWKCYAMAINNVRSQWLRTTEIFPVHVSCHPWTEAVAQLGCCWSPSPRGKDSAETSTGHQTLSQGLESHTRGSLTPREPGSTILQRNPICLPPEGESEYSVSSRAVMLSFN